MKKTLLICAAALLLSASVAQPQNIIATTATCTNATIDAGTAGCVIINVAGQGSLGFQITGTWTGTVTFSTSLGQNGADATFVTTLVTPVGSATQTSTATANGVWSLPVAGFNQFKIAITATGTGTAVVNRRTTSQARSSGGGGGGSGTVTSVGLSLPGGITVTNSPVTTTGTLTGTLFSGDTQVIYNDGGAFGGDAGLVFNETTDVVSVLGAVNAGTGTFTMMTGVINIPSGQCINSYYTGQTDIQMLCLSGSGIFQIGDGWLTIEDADGHAQFGGFGIVDIGQGGVRLSADADGAITFLGLGNGADEDLTFNFDDVANTVGVSSSTGVTNLNLGTIDLSTDVLNVVNTTTVPITTTGALGGLLVTSPTTNVVHQFLATTSGGNTLEFDIQNLETDPMANGDSTIFKVMSGANTLSVLVYSNDAYPSAIQMDGGPLELIATEVRFTGVIRTGGTTPSVANVGGNSCGTTAASITGNSNSGRVTVGATSGTQCRVTTTITAPTGWQCSVSNTTTAALARCVGVDTTHFDLVGVFTAADVLSYVALPN